MKEQIQKNFTYYSPSAVQVEKYDELRQQAKEFAQTIDQLCPNSREKSLAITKLEEVVMWANASIARNE